MKKEDVEFQKKCASWQKHIIKLSKDSKKEEINELSEHIKKSIYEWEEQIKTAKFRINMLKYLLVIATTKIR